MRALCKKSKILDQSCCIHNGQIYEIFKSSYIHGTGSYLIRVNKKSYSMAGGQYFEYFYSPEETTNILRTKLIDKMTNAKKEN